MPHVGITWKFLKMPMHDSHCQSFWCSFWNGLQPGEGNGTPLQYSCLENPMDGGAWWAAVHGVAEGWIRLSDFTFTFHFHALEKEMATHSSVLAWRIPGMGEPVGLPSVGSHRVRHDWSDLAAAAAVISDFPFIFKQAAGSFMGRICMLGDFTPEQGLATWGPQVKCDPWLIFVQC